MKYIDDSVVMKRMKTRLTKNKGWKALFFDRNFICFIMFSYIIISNCYTRYWLFRLGFYNKLWFTYSQKKLVLKLH